MSKLSKAHAALDKACRDHGQDPVEVRMAMISVILTNAAQNRPERVHRAGNSVGKTMQ